MTTRASVIRLIALTVFLAVSARSVGALRSVDEAILPATDYASAEGRTLAEAHGPELQALYEDVRRCAPELDFQLDGIAFHPSRRAPAGPYYLTLWVWLDGRRPPTGRDTAGRATEAFRQYGRKLVRQLSARGPVAADGRVAGYGLILTWAGPRKVQDSRVMESLALFARKDEAVAFGLGQTAPPGFLAAAEVHAFDGQTEVPFPPLAAHESPGPAGLAGC